MIRSCSSQVKLKLGFFISESNPPNTAPQLIWILNIKTGISGSEVTGALLIAAKCIKLNVRMHNIFTCLNWTPLLLIIA